MSNVLLDKLRAGGELSFAEARKLGDCSCVESELRFKFSFSVTSRIGVGDFGVVYSTDSNYCAAKVYNHNAWDNTYLPVSSNLELMERAFDNQVRMREKFNSDIVIPKARGLFNVFCFNKRMFYPAFVMDKFPGPSLQKWASESVVNPFLDGVKDRAMGILNDLQTRGHKSCYFSKDGWMESPLKNVLYNFGNDELGFVDFELDEVD